MISENNFSINFKLNVIKKLWYYCLGFLIYVIPMYLQDMQQVKKKMCITELRSNYYEISFPENTTEKKTIKLLGHLGYV